MRELKINTQVKRPDTPLASTPEPTWQKMTQLEKASKVNELRQKGGNERVRQYKDSVSTDAENRRNAAFEKNAATRGMTVEQLRKDNKKPDVKVDYVGPSSSKGGAKSPCKGGICPGLNTKS
jgi:hypothetical protein